VILNRQRAIRVSISGLDRFLSRAARTLRLPSGAVTVCLVSDARMASWNRAFRGKKGPTDVLSFPTNVHPRKKSLLDGHSRRGEERLRRDDESRDRRRNGLSPSYLGDIAIAPAVARKNARRCGRALRDELRVLILHGILHLLGLDHETDNGQMERREQRLRRALGIAG
jgi:probable rRNA maturation factor